jgi:hypothetical protein
VRTGADAKRHRVRRAVAEANDTGRPGQAAVVLGRVRVRRKGRHVPVVGATVEVVAREAAHAWLTDDEAVLVGWYREGICSAVSFASLRFLFFAFLFLFLFFFFFFYLS